MGIRGRKPLLTDEQRQKIATNHARRSVICKRLVEIKSHAVELREEGRKLRRELASLPTLMQQGIKHGVTYHTLVRSWKHEYKLKNPLDERAAATEQQCPEA